MSSKRPTSSEILQEIAECCLALGWGETRFGREFNGDPNFVRELRNGKKDAAFGGPRRLKEATRRKLREFIALKQDEAGKQEKDDAQSGDGRRAA